MMVRVRWLLLALAAALLGAAALGRIPLVLYGESLDEGACVQAGLPNLLQNPSFEGEYQVYNPPGGIPQCPFGPCTSVRTAPGWSPWWRAQGSDPLYYKMPEFTAAEESKRWYGPPRARSGDAAQQLFTLYSTHEAGVYQKVPVEPGVTYCFSAWGHSWTANDDPIPEKNHSSCPSPQGVGDACSGPEDGLYRQKIGLDPAGGSDWTSPTVVWSDQGSHPNGRLQYDSFGLFIVTATAQTSQMTVFLYGQPDYPVKHNNGYWDDATLAVTAQMVVNNAGELGLMTTPAAAVQISRSYPISLYGALSTGSWQASLTTGGLLTPTLNRTSGGHGDILTIGVNTAGLPLGSHTAEVTITAASPGAGSPTRIPVRVHIVSQITRIYLPLILR